MVHFYKDEPLATFFPIPRGYIESFKTENIQLNEKDSLYEEHQKWVSKREELSETQKQEHNYYMRGIEKIDENKVFKTHQRIISGCPFKNTKESL
jgi:hypothetical protein